eukprot:2375758-Alexandrium_andersonii.AAC.1
MLLEHLNHVFDPSESQQLAIGAYSLYVPRNGDPTRLRALCASESMMERWVGHLQFILATK